jgi:hypothetical protein
VGAGGLFVTDVVWMRGSLESAIHANVFHAVDPEAFIVELWLSKGRWDLLMTRPEENHYVTDHAWISADDPEAADKFGWAERKLAEFLQRRTPR